MIGDATISPSAKSLLLMKSQTAIPFAREAAELLWTEQGVAAGLVELATAPDAQRRLQHFEWRYRSIDAMLAELGHTRVLELAAGLSFRGLAMAARASTHYIDTDLPGIVDLKRELVAKLIAARIAGTLAGTLLVQPLDVLDPQAFADAVASLPPGPIAIVNEGLLVYLDAAQKAQLAANVRAALAARGGHWITADIYVQSAERSVVSEQTRQFLDAHHVEDNKFGDFELAERWVVDHGLAIANRGVRGRIRETWALAI